MNVTFLVTLQIEPEEDLATVADRISNKISNDFPVVNVKPWSRPKTAPSAKAQSIYSAFKTLPR